MFLVVYGMVGLINFHFSNGMLALFVDQPIDSTQRATTFRNGFTTHNDVWNVRIFFFLLILFS